MDRLAEAVIDGATADQLRKEELPSEYLAAHIRRRDQHMFAGVADPDVRKSIHVGPVPMPELAPDEVVVAVMASSINYNLIWAATFEPVSTFRSLSRLREYGHYGERHDRDYQVVGSDCAGVIVRVGDGVRRWAVGDRVLVSSAQVDDQEPMTHADGMLGAGQRAWGYETNFGGLAAYTIVRASQLIPKPAHLTWEEAACVPLCASTAYRMLVGSRGARIKQGDIVLIWGATGGLGSFAVQMVRNGGGIAVGVVGSARKAELARALGCDLVIDRHDLDEDLDDLGLLDRSAIIGKNLSRIIRSAFGEDPHVVFDYVGRETFGTSVFVVRRGGVVVTCGSSSGPDHGYDNRYLWMNLKSIIGSHGANAQEQWECMRLFDMGRLVPVLSRVFPLAQVGDAARLVQTNGHVGKVGVLALAPEPGLGVTDRAKRDAIGEDRLTIFRDTAPILGGVRQS
ncbi:crotonyl-CoA reductase [Actinoplanes sp. NBRC 14428]|nr:crotonyl-CoA reductase [Actinoplanes sp. NBRC 14428]